MVDYDNSPESVRGQKDEGPSLDGYVYENGWTMAATDLGGRGVKIDLGQSWYTLKAVILPPEQVKQYAQWLLDRAGLDKRGLPKDLGDILRRVCACTGEENILQHGDKAKIRRILAALEDE